MSKSKKVKITDYYRVSTKSEAQKTSMKNQPQYIKILLNSPQNKNFEHIGLSYFDWGISGTKLSRESFNQMLYDAGLKVEIERKDDIPSPINPKKLIRQEVYKVSVDGSRKPKFEEIWVKTTSRFARNINAFEILQVLRRNNVFVFFLDIGLSTRQKENMSAIRDKLSADMAYSEQNSRNRLMVQHIYEQENRISGCPYGYDYHKKNKNTLPYYTINPQKSIVVEKIFQYCIEGLGATCISQKLANEGFLTEDGKPFSSSTIRNCLTQEKYMGLNHVGKWTTGEVFEKLPSAVVREDYTERLKEHEGIPTIIPPEIWYKAQESRESRYTITEGKVIGKNPVHHQYKDLLVCGYCQKHFRYDNNNGRGFFACSTKKNEGKEICNCNNVFNTQLDAFIKNLEDGEWKRTLHTDFENTIITLLTFAQVYLWEVQNADAGDEETLKLKEELAAKKAARDELLDLLATGAFTKDTLGAFSNRVTEIDSDIATLQTSLNCNSSSYDKKMSILQNLFSVIFEELKIAKSIKESYTSEEILSNLQCIKIYGKTVDNRGGRPPEPILLPIPKTTFLAHGLISLGMTEFKFRLRNQIPNYFTPTKDEVHILDRDDVPKVSQRNYIEELPKEQWTFGSSKFPITNFAYHSPDGTLGLIPNLGVEGLTTLEQLEEATEKLYQTFSAL